ncbi:S-adenosyl-L-methionine-dependent methyltransferase [Elsinoe ampelina]|uniref:Protein arginine methyltransferase NDUFAF7 n=1 Tax=Elsinoe ampelina TaxID=302913 RepID=A0A6A6GEQ5_9PEZI|nr:S-adenosyl-L-methionine-dependent methyltransferase [Elsinoe ampelina]
MESAVLDRLFKRLFTHRPCTACARHALRPTVPRVAPIQTRSIHRRIERSKTESSWQQRTDYMAEDKLEEYKKVPMVTSDQLRNRRERPRRVKMLMRDFIEDSLYNPSYGYFSKQAVIFSPGDPFDFRTLPDEASFHRELGRRYTEFEDALDEKEYDETRQLWHTPTELFRPYYGEAIARYLVSNYKLQLYPYHDLLIYEMGAGNGTLMLNILDYIRATDPDVYARTQFRVIEVSSNLASLQAQQLQRTASAKGHADKVTIINKSIFDWDTYLPTPCFFLALEVWDNFAHDLIRYDASGQKPMQAHVLIDSQGDFFEFDSPALDPVAARFLRVRDKACSRPDHPYLHPMQHQKLTRRIKQKLPFQYNLQAAEYIPTRLMQFFDVLREYFPNHRLVASDFHALPDAVEGWCGPVVQTRYKRRMVPVSTPLVHQGYFDILFPTDFAVMEDVYRSLTGKLTRVSTHEDFFRRWAFVEDTRTRNGENPLLSWYGNASVMITV